MFIVKDMMERKCAVLCEKGGLRHLQTSIDPCKPPQSAQADMDQNFLLPLNFLHVFGSFKWIFMDP